MYRFQKQNVGAMDTGYIKVSSAGDEDALKEAVATIGTIGIYGCQLSVLPLVQKWYAVSILNIPTFLPTNNV